MLENRPAVGSRRDRRGGRKPAVAVDRSPPALNPSRDAELGVLVVLRCSRWGLRLGGPTRRQRAQRPPAPLIGRHRREISHAPPTSQQPLRPLPLLLVTTLSRRDAYPLHYGETRRL